MNKKVRRKEKSKKENSQMKAFKMLFTFQLMSSFFQSLTIVKSETDQGLVLLKIILVIISLVTFIYSKRFKC